MNKTRCDYLVYTKRLCYDFNFIKSLEDKTFIELSE